MMKINWPIFFATGVLIPTFDSNDEPKPKPPEKPTGGGGGMSVKKPPR